MAEDFDGALGIRASIDASDIQKGANDFIRAVQNMANESDKAVNTMADGYSFLMEQINKLSEAIDAAKGKLTSISGAMSNVAPADGVSSQAYDDLKSQIAALTSENDNLKSKLEETTASIAEQAKATASASTAMGEYQSVTQSAGNSGGIASVGGKAKSEMRELAETIKFDTEQIALMEQEYAKLEQTLNRLQSKKSTIEATPTSSDPLAQEVKQTKLDGVNSGISQTQEQMSRIKAITTEYKGEIAQCSQRMSELGNQTAQTTVKTQALRTQLRNARQHVAELILSGKQGTIEFGKAVNQANKLQAAFNKASLAISGKSLAFNSFNMLSTAVNGVTGALTTYMGVAGLFTDDQEELARIQKNLQAIMSVSMGVQQLMNAATQISVKWEALKASALAAVAASAEGATAAEGGKAAADVANTGTAAAATSANWTLAAAFKAVGLAIKSIPVIGWIIAGITALVAGAVALYKWVTKLTPAEKANQEAAKAYGEQLKKNRETMLDQSKSIGENVGKFKQLQQKYNDVKGDSKKLDKFIKDNKDNFEELGFSVDNATEAENIFHKNAGAVVEGFKLRAKAAAQAKVAMDSYAEAYRLQLEAEGWERSAKYGNSRHNKEDQQMALERAKAMRAQAGKLYNNADKAINDSNKTNQELDAYNKKHGIKSPTKNGGSGEAKSGEGSGSSGGGKSWQEIAYENAQKWHELQLDEEKAFNDKMKEYSDMVLETKEDGAEKELQQIQRTRNEQLKALSDWLDELAEKRRQVAMDTWVNAKEGRTEQQWSQTKQGKQDNEYWRNQVLTKNPRINEVYELNANAIQDKSIHDTEKVVDDILSKYENQNNKERKERLKTLAEDIKILEDKLTAIEDESEKERVSNLLKNAQSERNWLSQSKEAWNEYYQKYGTFLEKRKALEDKFLHDTQGMDEDTPEYLMLKKQKEEAESTLEAEEKLAGFDWMDAFGDLTKLSDTTLERVKNQLKDIIELDKTLNASDKAKFVEKYNKASDEIEKRKESWSDYTGNNWVSNIFKNKQQDKYERKKREEEYERAKQNYKDKVDEYNTAKSDQFLAEDDLSKKKGALNDFLQQNGSSLNADSFQGMDMSQALQMLQQNGGDFSQMGQQFKSLFSGFQGAQQGAQTAAANASQAAQAMQGAQQGMEAAQGAIGGGGGGGGAAMTEAIIKGINQNVQSLNQLVKKFGNEDSGFAQGMQDFAESSQEATEAFDSFKNGDFFGTILHLSNAIEKLGSSVAKFFGFNDGEVAYQKELKNYKNMSKIWDDLIDKKKEYINLSFGNEAKKEAESIQSLYKAEQTSLRSLTQRFLDKRSVNAHSQSYRNTEAVKNAGGFSAWSKSSGVNISRIEDLTEKDYSYKELLALKSADNGKFWGSLGEEVQNYLDKLIEAKKAQEDFAEDMKEKLTGVKFDTMVSDFMSCLEDMNQGADDWVNSFKDKIRKAIIDNMMGKQVKEWLEDYTKRYQDAMNKGTLTDAERQQFIDEANEKSNEFFNQRKEILENIGLGKSSDSSSSGGGFATASEESVEELSGRALAANEALYSIMDIESSHTMTYEAINDGIQQMITIEKGRNEYYNESIEIQRTSVSHLASIAKNTNELYAMNERLAKIEKNTRNM